MAEIVLDLKKSLEENASDYFEAAKKAKHKLAGALEALERSKKLLEKEEEKQLKAEERELQKRRDKKTAAPKQWYEKFRWFISSDSLLVIGGRDQTTNDILIKKHLNNDDLVFHADITGAPFIVIKAEGKKIPEASIAEAAQATAAFSRAWKLGLTVLGVSMFRPEQISLTPRAGEYLTKGAFMIYGKKGHHSPELALAIGIDSDGRPMCGPENAVEKHCKKVILIRQGRLKASDAAKKIKKALGGDLDSIIRALPSGGIDLA
ncbi:hypothetical protein COT48_00920 [Candidatus Woesearchaeota archaeon CG08_land_8_20_14_0_20_47_9]|nr:MAG: hypothetical protein AUJ69_01435 [Candidatus Woesearchaeota archaeon CG1_02_47_18]PIO04341.1 MAG: hypothetical protein COT48_00920 [Candidatus Woesearchaeota archaeon CG08_land_8_20_14_0_20_47_9]HII30021.1 DUF814 domain-containing protein [Candidatus Woesearchaeota archaeon]